jgi:glycosyltransferase involved in cell wall biosynthesis
MMQGLLCFITFLVNIAGFTLLAEKPIEFVIVTPSYNNEKWCKSNISSVANQTYPYWNLVYVNDASTDRTKNYIEEFVEKNHLQNKCQIIHNKKRVGAMANFYKVISKLDPHKVVVSLDGDDRLAHDRVLEFLANVYADKNVWITYGSYKTEPSYQESLTAPFPEEVIKNRSFRSYRWVASHLRTYFAKLFQCVKKRDFMWKGSYVKSACDIAIMMPLLELAANGHIRYIPEILYLYNVNNPISDVVIHRKLQATIEHVIRKRLPYQPLSVLF